MLALLKVRVGEVVETLECFVLDMLVDLGDVDGWTCACDDLGGVRTKLNKTEPCANSTEKWREVRTG
jgi:hypothetical protein